MNSILFGLGFMVGVCIFFIALLILIKILLSIKKKNPFTVELLEKYKAKLIRNEDYEEVAKISEIITSINAGNIPDDLDKTYKVKKKVDFFIDESGKIKYKKKLKIVKKSIND